MISIAQLLPVSWWHVIVDLEKHGYTHPNIAASIGTSRAAVDSWKNRNIEPSHETGERLCALWRTVTSNKAEDVPRRARDQLSAAAVR